MTQRFGFNDFKSPEERTKYERAPTMPDSIAPERLTGQGSVVDGQRTNTGTSVKAVLGISLFSIGLGIAGTYAVYKKSGWFDNKNERATAVSSVMPSASASEEHPTDQAPSLIQSDQDLAKVIEIYHIKAGESDFETLSARNNFMEALQLVPLMDQPDGQAGNPAAKKLSYKWRPMEPNKITIFKDDEVVVTTLIKHAPSAQLLDYRGVKPVAAVPDKDNPKVIYHYYRCVEGNTSGVGSIVIRDSKRFNKNTMLYGLQMPKCKPKDDPNMTQ